LFGTCGSASMAVALLRLAPAAIAQDTGTTVAGQRGETTEAAQNAIIVTGSRIARRDYSANSPLVTVGQDSFENRSDIGVEETLNELPQFTVAGTSSLTSSAGTAFTGANEAPGAATLNLRGLGSNRTLVLVNG